MADWRDGPSASLLRRRRGTVAIDDDLLCRRVTLPLPTRYSAAADVAGAAAAGVVVPAPCDDPPDEPLSDDEPDEPDEPESPDDGVAVEPAPEDESEELPDDAPVDAPFDAPVRASFL